MKTNRFLITVCLLIGCNSSSNTDPATAGGDPKVRAADLESIARASDPSERAKKILELLDDYEGLTKYDDPKWDTCITKLQSSSTPYTLTLIDELAMPIGSKSLNDPKVDIQLQKLDRLGKAIYAKRPSGELTIPEIVPALEVAAYADLKSHPLKQSITNWTEIHLAELAKQPNVSKELESIRDNYQTDMKLESTDDDSKSMQSVVQQSARDILNRAR